MDPLDPGEAEVTRAYVSPRYGGAGRSGDADWSQGPYGAGARSGGGPYSRGFSYDDYIEDDRAEDTEPHGWEGRGGRRKRGLRIAIGVGVALFLVGALTLAAGTLGPRLNRAQPPGGGSATAGSQAPAGGSDLTPSATASPTPPPTSKPPATKAPVRTPPGEPGLEAQVVDLVNVERAKIPGCPPLRTDSRLTIAARKHSADMQARDYFDHTTPDGVDAATRIRNEGYQLEAMGENIEKGSGTAAEVMETWMNSPGHRGNILDCNFRDIGVGARQVTTGPRFWTQDFGKPS